MSLCDQNSLNQSDPIESHIWIGVITTIKVVEMEDGCHVITYEGIPKSYSIYDGDFDRVLTEIRQPDCTTVGVIIQNVPGGCVGNIIWDGDLPKKESLVRMAIQNLSSQDLHLSQMLSELNKNYWIITNTELHPCVFAPIPHGISVALVETLRYLLTNNKYSWSHGGINLKINHDGSKSIVISECPL